MINAEVMLVLKTGKRPPGKKTSVSNPYPPGNCLLFDPTSSRNFRCPQWGGGGGGGKDILWNYTLELEAILA